METALAFIAVFGIPAAIIGFVMWGLNHLATQRALSLFPEDFEKSIIFNDSIPTIAFDTTNRKIAFAGLRKIHIIDFADVKSWQHTWTNNSKTFGTGIVATTSHSETSQTVKIVAHNLPKPSIDVFFHRNKARAAELADTFALLMG